MRLIDADELISKLEQYATNLANGHGERKNILWRVRGVDKCIGYVENAPTIEPEPIRHGHWKRVSTDNWICSNCNSWWHSDDEDFRAEMEYCPNCGAKMDEEERK